MTSHNTDAMRDRMLEVGRRVTAAAAAAGRDPADVKIMLATKAQPAPTVNLALELSNELYGYSLSAESRAESLAPYGGELNRPDSLHFIGHLQTNKVARVLEKVDVLQTVDRPRLVEVLDRRLQADGRTLDVFIQVNVSDETSKSGVAVDDAWALVLLVATTSTLRLKGFMTIGLNSPASEPVRTGYAALRELRDQTLASGLAGTATATELSMGMSGDLELAIAEGATMVRVGTAIFGARSH